MKRRIKSMLAAMSLMAVVISASAQPHGDRPKLSPEDRAKFMVEKMTEQLDLTAEQQQQIIDLHKELANERGERPERTGRNEMKKGERPSKEEMEKMKEGREQKMEERKAEMKARMEAHQEKMKEILTPAQFEKWQETMKEMPHRQHRPEARKHDGKRHHKGPRPAEAKECNCENKG